MRRRSTTPLAGRVSSNFGGSVNHRTKKIIAGLLFTIIAPLVATSLAASVTLNSGNSFEFGQGSNLTIACDSTITTALTETWVNGSSYFKVATIVLSGIDVTVASTTNPTTNSGCGNKLLKVSLLDSSGSAINIGALSGADTTFVTVAVPTGASCGSTSTGSAVLNGATVTTTCASSVASMSILIAPVTVTNATGVYRIAIESA